MYILKVIVALGVVDCILAFMPSSLNVAKPSTKRTTKLQLDFFGGAETLVIPEDSEQSRIAFFVWFFGASGAAGIARSAFPRMYKQVRTIQSLKDEGPTKGGETIGISPLVGYPRDLSLADVDQIINNELSVEQIVSKYPVEGNFLSARGYLTFKAFQEANANANPLTVRAVFDTFSTSTDVVNPEKAQEMIDEYQKSVDSLKNKLLVSKMVGYASIFLLLFMLGLADTIAAGHAYTGWFPEWPGGKNFPMSMFTEEGGSLFNIFNYWI